MSIHHFLDAALNGDSIGGTFLRAHLTSNALRYLHRRQHHVRLACSIPGNGGEQFVRLCPFSIPRRACHIQTAHRAQVHTNTTIDTRLLIDLKTIGHTNLLSGMIAVLTPVALRPWMNAFSSKRLIGKITYRLKHKVEASQIDHAIEDGHHKRLTGGVFYYNLCSRRSRRL